MPLRSPVIRAAWIIAMLAVLVATLAPVPDVPDLPTYTDKLVHLVCYLVLGTLAALAQRGRRNRIIATMSMIAFGIGIEIVQAQLPWRSFEWADIAANAVGAAIGGAFGAWARPRPR